MLSAHKEEIRLQSGAPKMNLPTFASVSNVFNSIQGLQQRVDDFTLADIEKAVDTSKTLIVRLAELHKRLARIAEIELKLTAARSAMNRAAGEIVNPLDSELSGLPPRFHDFVQTAKVIEFPGTARLGWDGLEALPKSGLKKEASRNEPTTQTTRQDSPFNQRLDATETDPELLAAINPQAFDPGPELNQESDDPLRMQESAATAYDASPVSDPPLEDETEEPSFTPATGEGSDSSFNRPTDAAGNDPELLAAIDLQAFDPGTELNQESDDPPRTQESAATAYKASQVSDPPLEDETEEPSFVPATASKVGTPEGADFDQRLLDDLIKNYGEFVSSPNVPAIIEPEPETPRSKATLSLKDSTIGRDEAHSATRRLPTIQKEGEIDRKLKKLIKDYGEYDLYSRQSPVNLKTGVIGAFLLLGMLFLGFYFFSAPKPAIPSQPPSMGEPAAISTQGGSSLPNDKNRGAVKHPRGVSGTPVELPRTAEASERNPVAEQR